MLVGKQALPSSCSEAAQVLNQGWKVMRQTLQRADRGSRTRIRNLPAARCLLALTSHGAFQLYWITLGRLNGIVKLRTVEGTMGQLPSAAESSSTALSASVHTWASSQEGGRERSLRRYILKGKGGGELGYSEYLTSPDKKKTSQKLIWKGIFLKTFWPLQNTCCQYNHF